MVRAHRTNVRALAAAISLFASAYAQTLNSPGQPSTNQAPLGQFKIVGDSIVSAQQLFLGTTDKVYIVDKVENNPAKINGHPAWASEYSISKNSGRAMDVVTNSFCAGGTALGNGTWLNVGGNQAVGPGGVQADSQLGGGIYDDPDGGKSLLNPCDDSSCEWTLVGDMSTRRWYPTVETLDDGSAIILGGCLYGGYVNAAVQDNPTNPSPPTSSLPTLPVNLYPLTWMLPSGKLLMQSNWKTTLLDYRTQKETPLDDMLDAVRVYPASGGTAMLALTPDNNYTATILFCGGSNLQSTQWVTNWDIAQYNASNSCVRLTPDVSPAYEEDDPLPEGRSMGNLILLPNGKIIMLNGAQTGTAGYGTETWAVDESYADNPVLMPIMYDPSAPQGKRWSRDGLSPSTVPRMYHSSATLLPDGSVFVSGSNPHADYAVDNVKFPTEYRVEYFYPSYYNQRRPEPKGLLTSLSYGGDYFNVTLTKDDLFGDVNNVKNTQVVILRTGFSTHTMNMGQRMLQLGSTYTGNGDDSATLHVSQMPPNPATFPPGPALAFVVVNGVPSVGVQVMIGNGKIGQQPTSDVATLPSSAIASGAGTHSDGSGNNVSPGGHKNYAGSLRDSVSSFAALLVTALASLTMFSVL
ncbi:copper radical oxidase [Ganoderma leucocontextum]|nr:copper radical oxidase [Ganoderma leucocontextum]